MLIIILWMNKNQYSISIVELPGYRIPLTILHAKFCTDCSLSIFNLEQLAHKFEQ